MKFLISSAKKLKVPKKVKIWECHAEMSFPSSSVLFDTKFIGFVSFRLQA